ncbi:hypothetical protein KY495_17495 [Massilia sp. PAMC28688]|uniref:hypothetical protein n=1 Tax=Massilia sp. PAMC28688 TaxID=2861283 RepID=UPI001C636425|nr:hypothetical protein [Massilia sp. PAMC28688]QYF92523.1 hypothetical protein KY495_17495 [Massilia sp. PAMC28688]
MSLPPASGPRPPASPILPALPQAAGRTAGMPVPVSGKIAAALPVVDPVALPDDIVRLSRQAIEARSEAPVSTSESAQNLIGSIARNMFGDTASTAAVSYNMSSYQARALEGGAGEREPRSAQLDLSQNASFYGVGEIVTREGQRFDFEVAVKYTSNAEGELRTKAPPIQMPDVLVLTGKPLPAIKFPGGLQDLFKLLSRELRTDVSDGDASGSLNLRLMRLVDRAALLAPRARPDTPDVAPAERARAVANAYGSPALGDAISA